jgi:hypothetical protein
MQVLPISYQKYYVQIQLEICREIFDLVALIDTGSDINLFIKIKSLPNIGAQVMAFVTGLGNHDVNFKYEVSRVNILLGEYSIGMRFHIADAPIDCILGTPFLSMVSPHGSCMINQKPGYFITLPAFKNIQAKS